ncbi:MAG: hypothetical protein ACRCXZ_05995 [Patescibacteria group bacterium]
MSELLLTTEQKKIQEAFPYMSLEDILNCPLTLEELVLETYMIQCDLESIQNGDFSPFDQLKEEQGKLIKTISKLG